MLRFSSSRRSCSLTWVARWIHVSSMAVIVSYCYLKTKTRTLRARACGGWATPRCRTHCHQATQMLPYLSGYWTPTNLAQQTAWTLTSMTHRGVTCRVMDRSSRLISARLPDLLPGTQRSRCQPVGRGVISVRATSTLRSSFGLNRRV